MRTRWPRRQLFALAMVLAGCGGTTTPTPIATTDALLPGRTDTFLCRLVATTRTERDRLAQAVIQSDRGDKVSAAAAARRAFASVSDAMSNRPTLPMPSPRDATLVLMLAWPDVAAAEMTLAAALAPDLGAPTIPVVDPHSGLVSLDKALDAARNASRDQDPSGDECSAAW